MSPEDRMSALETIAKALTFSYDNYVINDSEGKMAAEIIEEEMLSISNKNHKCKKSWEFFVRRRDGQDGRKPRHVWVFMKDMRRTTSLETSNVAAWAEEIKRYFGAAVVSYVFSGSDKEGYLLLDVDKISRRPDTIFTIGGKKQELDFKSSPSDKSPRFKIEDLRSYSQRGAGIILVINRDGKRINWLYFGPQLVAGLYEESSGFCPGNWAPRDGGEEFGHKPIMSLGEDEMEALIANGIIISRPFGSDSPITPNDRRVSRLEMDEMLNQRKES
jgi:hypothetical protein